MKASEYLWKYFELNEEHPEYSNAQVQGELRLKMGDSRTAEHTPPSPAHDELGEVSSHQAPSASNTEGDNGATTVEVQASIAEDQREGIPLVKEGDGIG